MYYMSNGPNAKFHFGYNLYTVYAFITRASRYCIHTLSILSGVNTFLNVLYISQICD